ncbi:hypothetical protein [Streptomyces bobili]|uniref:hypothetical protein n=1 Tax=Streptomyces bobili TaxID=67280 RepID=UPI0037184EF2
MDRTAEVPSGEAPLAEVSSGQDRPAEPSSGQAEVSSGEDHRPGVDSNYAGDNGHGDDPTPQEE